MDNENDIFEHALSNVNFVSTSKGVMLFIFSLLEVNTNDVRFYLSDKEGENKNERHLILVPASDQSISISITDDKLYNEIEQVKAIKIFEVDWTTGQTLRSYNAIK